MRIIENAAKAGLDIEGSALMDVMRREVHMTNHGGAPGKPEWRDAIAEGIKVQERRGDNSSIEMDLGYKPEGTNELVRAMIVTDGSGSAVGNPRIHAGPEGRHVWDEDVSGQHPSLA